MYSLIISLIVCGFSSQASPGEYLLSHGTSVGFSPDSGFGTYAVNTTYSISDWFWSMEEPRTCTVGQNFSCPWVPAMQWSGNGPPHRFSSPSRCLYSSVPKCLSTEPRTGIEFSHACLVRSSRFGFISSAPRTYSAPSLFMKSFCVSTSKKIFIAPPQQKINLIPSQQEFFQQIFHWDNCLR